MDDGARIAARLRSTEIATGLIATLLLVIAVPLTLAQYWTPRAAIALLVIGPGLVVLTVAARARDHASIAGLVFVAVAGLSTLVSPAPGLALFGLYNHGTGLLFVAAVVAMWALGRRWSDVGARVFGSAVLVGAGVNAAMAWLQVSENYTGDLFALIDGRPPALLGNPVHASALFLGAFAIVVERWRVAPARRETSAVYLALAVLFASALELAGGRIGLVVLLGVLGVLGLRAWRRVVPLAIAVAVGVLGTMAIAPDDSGAASRVAGSGSASFSGRIDRWEMGFAAFADRPVLGEGPGLYRRATSPHNTASAARAFGSDTLNIDAHDVFVEYLVTTGLVGALAFTAWLVLAARGARGELAWFAGVGAVSLLFQPQFVGLTPVLALALGVAKRGPPVRISRPAKSVAILIVVTAVVAGVALVRGDMLLRNDTVDLDLRDARAAARALPIWPEPAAREAQAYRYAFHSDHRAGALADAVAAARVAHRRDPSDPGVSLALGGLELGSGHRTAARAAYADARRWDPFSAQALIALSAFAKADGDQRESERLCARALSVAPGLHCRFDLNRGP
ncbi:MAG: O-antigen ligase family protein [Acidimicrobiia bacterium]